ncbi:hypothetical protein [Chitinimonas naiadis]
MNSEPLAPLSRLHYQLLAEPYVFALLTWPAAALVEYFQHTGQNGYRIATLVWLAVFHLAAYGRQRGLAFGNLLLVLSVSVVIATASFPSPWVALELPVLLIGLYAAQRARLQNTQRQPTSRPQAAALEP